MLIINFEEILAYVGAAVCVIVPLIVALAVYANYGIYRKGGEDQGKWRN